MNDNKRIAFNSVIIFLRLFITSIIGVFISRLVLAALGASDYGLYNVVGGIVVLLNVLNTAMLSTTYRYIAFELGKGDNGQPNKVFNTCLLIHASFALFILVVGFTVGEWYIIHYLNVDPGKISDARFVFHISLFTTAISTFLVPFQGMLVAFERFSVNAVIDILTICVRLLLILVLLKVANNQIRCYSLINMSYHIMAGLCYVVYSLTHYFSIIRFRLYRDVSLYKEMLSYASWSLFGMFANSCKMQGSVILVNLFFGTLVNAAYAVANQVEGFIKTFALTLNSAAVPQITKNFSGGNTQRSLFIASYISKYTFILMSLVAFPVLLEMDFLLDLWLKEVPQGACVFCRLMVLGGLFDCLGEGITPLFQASGKIKGYYSVINTLLLLGLPLAFVFYKFGFSEYTITIVFCVISLLIAFAKILLLKRILHFDVHVFVDTSYIRIALMSVPLILFYFFYTPPSSFGGHILCLCLSELFLIADVFLLGFGGKERSIVFGLIPKVFGKNFKEQHKFE